MHIHLLAYTGLRYFLKAECSVLVQICSSETVILLIVLFNNHSPCQGGRAVLSISVLVGRVAFRALRLQCASR